MIGHTLGSYSIQRELGRGGMGAVYVGVHALLGRTAAVKVLLPELSRNQDIVQRFFNEARAATAIRHPGIVEIYDFGYSPDGSAYIVMEYLEGEALASRLRRLGRLHPVAALGIARQVATALAAAHRAGIVHRDLKPDNVFLVPDAETSIGERVKLLDFGIAKLAGDATGGAMARTSTGAIMGTPYYMSPEQCRGAGQVDARSDLYSLGCMLFEMVVGRVPFVGEGGGEIIAAHIHVPAPPARSLAADVPPEVEALIARLMAKRAEDRPQSADAAAQEIGEVAHRIGGTPMTASHPIAATPVPSYPPVPTTLGTYAGQPATAPPPKAKSRTALWIVLAVLLLGGIAAAGILVMSDRPERGAAGPESKDGGAPSSSDAALAVVRDAAPVVGIDAAPAAVDAAIAVAPPDASTAATSDREKLLATALELAAAGNWQRAAELARALLALDPADPGAKALADEYFALTSPKVAAHVKKKDCSKARSQAAEAVKLWPGDKRGAALEKSAKACKEDRKPPVDAGVPDPDPPHDTPTFDQLLQNATSAYEKGQYAQALRLCELALDEKPKSPKALRLCGLSACFTKNASKARAFARRVGARQEKAIRAACTRNGIDLDDSGGGY